MIRVRVKLNETEYVLNCNDNMNEAISLFLSLVKSNEDFVTSVEIKRLKRGKIKNEE